MSTQTLKSISRRGSLLGAAFAVALAAVVPAASVFADTLNPLTERSLLLSSSAPGYLSTDGSGNAQYAPAGSGPNGKKTGQTYSFKVSTDSTQTGKEIKAFTLQYCTSAAGKCQAPGNNPGDARVGATTPRGPDSVANKTSDLNVNYTSAVEGTDFTVYVRGVATTGWTLTTSNAEDTSHSGALTGAKNMITLTNPTLADQPESMDAVKIVFKASETNYITNPGDDAFFVKINSYDSDDPDDHVPAVPVDTPNVHIIDGGVTVANVMTDSIHITTKVLETMSFSVGTQNRDTVVLTNPAVHGTCDPILQTNGNQLQLGNPDAEYSLETDTAWDVNSYWRLSSNSSGGATVYYSGNTLANTVGDEIAEIGGAATSSTPGTEQFGLGFVDAGADSIDPTLSALYTSQADRFKAPSLTRDLLTPNAAYANGTGTINGASPTATFAFKKSSNTIPEVIAANSNNVISCATAKMRYIANIGADTPAGVYTTKINYLAAPQY